LLLHADASLTRYPSGMPADELPIPANPLWVFIDESGNFDFAATGTRHYLMTAVVTADPAASGAQMLGLKYEQMLRGSNQLDFHATHNSRGTRKRVLELIGGLTEITSHTFVTNKGALAPSERNLRHLLALFAQAIANWAISQALPRHDHLTLVFDTAFPGGQAEFIKHHVKTILATTELAYAIHFHRVANEPNGQIADYIAWSHARFLTRIDDEGVKHLTAGRHTLQWLNK
jgi:hypothetical protein